MKNFRIFVEKKADFQTEALELKSELNENLQLKIQELRLLNVYDLFGFTEDLLNRCRYRVFGEIVTDKVSDECLLDDYNFIAIEYLPGQFDQRASSAIDCVHLLEPNAQISIKTARLILLDKELSAQELERIKSYCINEIECQEKDLNKLEEQVYNREQGIIVLDGFTSIVGEELNDEALTTLEDYVKDNGLAMSAEDLYEVITYFRKVGREPNETELKILDTYWSDHCRHTTFTSELEAIQVEESFIKKDIDASLALYQQMREVLARSEKPITLMDMATIGAKYLRKEGLLEDLEVSEENNACSIYVDVEHNGKLEKWLLMFKNETHNHPTEIEPYGGAATCLGGAIRDPLSGRAYVYQALRITGASPKICKDITQTRAGKLPQKVISKKAATGYSSYGNQIGLATTLVKEIYHSGYEAKRLELGAVVGAVPAENVRRESPKAGDIILLLGGKTGRDGVGGATGSSKGHTEASLQSCGSEVQKGNAPEERKIQRLFRNKNVTQLIKKANDFGAGGVSVAIGELADGLDIYLDHIPCKYQGLNATELAISESQERMAVVIEAKDKELFKAYCDEENIDCTEVAEVREEARMRLFYKGQKVVDLSRAFINSAGAKHYAQALISAVKEENPFRQNKEEVTEASIRKYVSSLERTSQKGLVEMFDATIGRSTVLMPFGGDLQKSPTQVSVQKLPTKGYTDTASMMTYGFEPYLSEWSPYHGSAYAIVEACSKIVSAGAKYDKLRFSYQEYFEHMTANPRTWGKPSSALLGALKMQEALGLPAIGGKDSMSGNFDELAVPPSLVAFGITTVNAKDVVSTELKEAGNKLYLLEHKPLENYMPNTDQLKEMWTLLNSYILQGKVISAYTIGKDGVLEGALNMLFGNQNKLGLVLDVEEIDLFNSVTASILVEAREELEGTFIREIGRVTDEASNLVINGTKYDVGVLTRDNEHCLADLYPVYAPKEKTFEIPQQPMQKARAVYHGEKIEKPLVYIPIFPGTNCEYDTEKAFVRAGAKVHTTVFCNRTAEQIQDSIAKMKSAINEANILVLAGGFSVGDEPDGSGKFIANVLAHQDIKEAVEDLLKREGLILGICNGFQALIKSGLLPYGKIASVNEDSPTLFRNTLNRHISHIAQTKVLSTASPWLSSFKEGEVYGVAISHGEGKFVINESLAKNLFEQNQVAFQYLDNPNGSSYAIEGIISPDGQILGKMGHSERYEENLYKNISYRMDMPIFENAVKYFKGE